MGIGFVLVLWMILSVAAAAVAALVLRSVTSRLTRRNDDPRAFPARQRLLRAAYLLPFYALAWAGAVFAFQALINTELLDRDMGAGDAAYCPLPNGYSIGFVDVMDQGDVYDSRRSAGEPDAHAAASGVRLLQVAGAMLLGASDTRYLQHLDQRDPPLDRYFLIDTRTGKRADFTSVNDLRDAAAKSGITLTLEPVSTIYDRYRYTWFDLFAVLLLLLPPVIACARLLRSILRWRRGDAPASLSGIVSTAAGPTIRALLPIAVLASLCACSGLERPQSAPYDVTQQLPHDTSAFTEGLVVADSVLFESTGLYGHSDLRRVDLRSGRVLASRPLSTKVFGEGLTYLQGRLFQLTWKERVAYIYDAATLTLIDSLHYAGEGWGLTTDGTSLIMSDGSDSLRVVAPATFQLQRVVHVRYNGAPLYQLNELEYVHGDLFANVYQTNWIARIDPASGAVREVIDFGELYTSRTPTSDVMNGIALAPDGQQLLLTGKRWPTVFQVRLSAPQSARLTR